MCIPGLYRAGRDWRYPSRVGAGLRRIPADPIDRHRLAHALDNLASHMDIDQFALASFSEDHREGVAAILGGRKPRFKER